jgi:Ca2+-binding RTX toxin-like protein
MPFTSWFGNNSNNIMDISQYGNYPDGIAIYGYGGTDWIWGAVGNDELIGGAGADYLDGRGGFDWAMYDDSNVGVIVSLASWSGSGGTAEGDVLVNIEGLYGSMYGDSLIGNAGNNALSGDAGTDHLYGGDGQDALDGGTGADHLYGGAGADNLLGGENDDTLWGGEGGDSLNGGSGIDTAVYSGSSARVSIALWSGTAHYGEAEGDTFTNIENLTGSAYDDALVGGDGVNVLHGLGGDDDLKGFAGADSLWGGNGDDNLFGHDDADTLHGDAGNDGLDGGQGADTMIGGSGNDTYYVDNLGDMVTEFSGQGLDVVRTSTSYTLAAGAYVERLETTNADGVAALYLIGSNSANEIIGNNGANTISGGGGADQMTGRGGADSYFVDHANDSITEAGGQGVDQVFASLSWTLTEGADVETLATNHPIGTAALNLTGNASGNVIIGNWGNNVLNGGAGDDELQGLYGEDSFLFNTTLDAATNLDVITDFNVVDDTIQLDDAIFSSSLGLGNISAGEFVIGAAALDANDRIIYNSSTGALFYDSDGNGGTAAIQFAQVNTGLALTNLDFLVV